MLSLGPGLILLSLILSLCLIMSNLHHAATSLFYGLLGPTAIIIRSFSALFWLCSRHNVSISDWLQLFLKTLSLGYTYQSFQFDFLQERRLTSSFAAHHVCSHQHWRPLSISDETDISALALSCLLNPEYYAWSIEQNAWCITVGIDLSWL